MTRPWMPFYVADYLGDTRHLSTLEHGAYLLLIFHYWQRGSLPADDGRLAIIAGLSAEEWGRCRPVIAEFFGPGWTHRRIDDELAAAVEKSGKARAAARASWDKRKGDDKPPDMQTHMRTQSERSCERNASAMLSTTTTTERDSSGNPSPTPRARAGCAAPPAEGDLRQAIASAFTAAGSITVPDTSRAAVWIAKGYDPAICIATISELLARNPGARSLAYFEPAIAEAHAPAAARAPPAGRPPNRPLTMIDGLIAHDARQAARTDR